MYLFSLLLLVVVVVVDLWWCLYGGKGYGRRWWRWWWCLVVVEEVVISCACNAASPRSRVGTLKRLGEREDCEAVAVLWGVDEDHE